jgi:hypothetical protein
MSMISVARSVHHFEIRQQMAQYECPRYRLHVQFTTLTFVSKWHKPKLISCTLQFYISRMVYMQLKQESGTNLYSF